MSGRWTADRWAASSGMLFAILLVAGNVLPGTNPPHYNSSTKHINNWLAVHHNKLVISGIIGGVLIVLWLWFLASYAGMFRAAGQGRLATIIYGAGVVGVSLAAIGGALMLAATQLHGTAKGATVAAFYGVSIFFYLKMFWAMAALAFASYLASMRSSALPEWFGLLSLAGGVVFVLGGLAIRKAGFFSPAGAIVWIAFFVFAAWVFIGSWLCMVKQAPAHAMNPAMSH